MREGRESEGGQGRVREGRGERGRAGESEGGQGRVRRG